MFDARAKVAVIFIGIPASGKTSYYHMHFSELVHVNLDTLKTRYRERTLLEACVKEGKSFVVDNTNPTKADRQRYIELAQAHGYAVYGYFFKSVVSECVIRNESRTGKARIVTKAIAAISNKLELPEHSEGFDGLYFIHMVDDGFLTEEWRDDK